MQAKWDRINVSTLVLYLCELLFFEHPSRRWIYNPPGFEIRGLESIHSPPPTNHLHSYNLAKALAASVFLETNSVPRLNLRKKKALPKLALRKCVMIVSSTYKPRSVRSWLDEASLATIGAIIHLDPTSPRGSSSLPEAREERAAPRPHKRALPLLGLAPGGGCLAADIAAGAGGLLHHLFTLASKRLAP